HVVFNELLTFDETRSGEELQAKFMKEKGAVISDEFLKTGDKGFLFEDEVGWHTIGEMSKKSILYQKKYADLQNIFKANNLLIVWNLRIWKQVMPLVEALRAVPGNGMFRVCHHGS